MSVLTTPLPIIGSTPRVLIRDIIAPLVGYALTFLLPPSVFIAGFLIVGQAHFFISILYQYRAGKVDRRYLLIAAAFLFGSAAYFIFGGAYYPLLLVSTFFFSIHFAFDEYTLHGEVSGSAGRMTAIAFVLLFTALTLKSYFPAQFYVLAFIVALLFCSHVVLRLFSKTPAGAAERYLWLNGFLILLMSFVFGTSSLLLFGVLSLLHLFNWYFDYGRRLSERGDQARLSRYWKEVVVSLALFFLLYLIYTGSPDSFLRYFFLPVYYYAFALAHFGLSALKKRAAA